MTPAERSNPEILNGSRRTRIAKGSGTTIQEVNRLLKLPDTKKEEVETSSFFVIISLDLLNDYLFILGIILPILQRKFRLPLFLYPEAYGRK